MGARIQTAGTKGKRTEAVAVAVKCMDATLRGMNLDKIAALMDKH